MRSSYVDLSPMCKPLHLRTSWQLTCRHASIVTHPNVTTHLVWKRSRLGDRVWVGDTVAVEVGVCEGDDVSDAVSVGDCVGVHVAELEGDANRLRLADGVALALGVCDDVRVGETVGSGLAGANATFDGGSATPRNTDPDGAVAITASALLPVSYE